MNKEVKVTLSDLYIGYACTAFIMYAIGSAAYYVGKTKGKIEICNKIDDLLEKHSL